MTVFEKIKSMDQVELYNLIDEIYLLGWSNGYDARETPDGAGGFFKFYLDMDYGEFMKQFK